MARAPKKVDSVYDFIYVDARRIGVLFSQLGAGTDGIPTELRRETTTGSQVGGGLSVHVAKADVRENESAGLVRTFDPQWLIPPRFLDLAKDLINRDPSSARLGELVLGSGSLRLQDFRTLQKILGRKTLKDRLVNSQNMTVEPSMLSFIGVNEDQTPTNAQKIEAKRAAFELVTDVLDAMPSRAQMTIAGSSGDLWGVLREDGMIVSYDELALTHGTTIPGDWVVVGLLDGHLDSEPTGAANPVAPQGFINSATAISALTRKMVGRPYGTYAITPLMIFRSLTNQ